MNRDAKVDDATPQHPHITELLPDYALGALPEPELDAVARHLEGCASCRRELRRVLAIGAILADVSPPTVAARGSLVSQATGRIGPATPPPAVAPVALRPRSAEARPRRAHSASRAPVWVGLAAMIVLAVGLAAWNVRLQREVDERDTVAAVLSGSVTAHPLTDSELVPPASGVLFADLRSEGALLVAHDLPPLPPERRYQVWLFTDAGERVSAGLIAVGADGHIAAPIETPAPLARYVAVALSAEPAAGSAAPTSPLALGGWLPPG